MSAGHISNASEIRREVAWCTAVERAVSQDGDFETDSFRYSQPVKADQRVCDMVVLRSLVKCGIAECGKVKWG